MIRLGRGALVVAVAAIVAIVLVALRREPDEASPPRTPPPSMTAVVPRPRQVVMLGWARPVTGHRGKYGRAAYVHEIELEDGRQVRYGTDTLFGRGGCVKVRALEETGRLTVLGVMTSDEPCPERSRR